MSGIDEEYPVEPGRGSNNKDDYLFLSIVIVHEVYTTREEDREMN